MYGCSFRTLGANQPNAAPKARNQTPRPSE